MKNVINVGNYILSLDSIIRISTYDDENIEYIGDKNEIWFPLCLFKKEIYDGLPVWRSSYGGRYITRGKRKVMTLCLVDGKTISTDFDEEIISKWSAFKNSQ
jgi:hypothetical protein